MLKKEPNPLEFVSDLIGIMDKHGIDALTGVCLYCPPLGISIININDRKDKPLVEICATVKHILTEIFGETGLDAKPRFIEQEIFVTKENRVN
jgi:hypothetical protein